MAEGRHSFNPLDREELARTLGRALLLTPCEPLPPPEPFAGAGVYAIYYQGDFAAYELVAFPDCEWPIYVGRAMPPGGRKGMVELRAEPGNALFNRLQEHEDSVSQARNVDPDDFRCRYLVVDDIWIPLAERLVISHYRPLWNVVVDGFGIHDPGGKPGGTTGRAGQRKSPWDTLHPGRPFAEGRADRRSSAELRKAIRDHLRDHPPRRDAPPPEPGERREPGE
jgi:hypothetical protein